MHEEGGLAFSLDRVWDEPAFRNALAGRRYGIVLVLSDYTMVRSDHGEAQTGPSSLPGFVYRELTSRPHPPLNELVGSVSDSNGV